MKHRRSLAHALWTAARSPKNIMSHSRSASGRHQGSTNDVTSIDEVGAYFGPRFTILGKGLEGLYTSFKLGFSSPNGRFGGRDNLFIASKLISPHAAARGEYGVAKHLQPGSQNRMLIKTILNRIEMHCSFVYGTMRRVDCPTCGVVVEQVPWAEGKQQLTTSYKLFLAQWAKMLTWSDVAKRFKTSWESVFRSHDSIPRPRFRVPCSVFCIVLCRAPTDQLYPPPPP